MSWNATISDSSEEGNFVKGLSLIPGKVLDLKKKTDLEHLIQVGIQ